MELERNKKILEDLYKYCETNKSLRAEKKGQECTMVSQYFGTSAAELLYVNRYLDLEEDFYKILYRYIDYMVFLNRNLELWDAADMDAHAEKLMVGKRNFIFESIEKVKAKLNF